MEHQIDNLSPGGDPWGPTITCTEERFTESVCTAISGEFYSVFLRELATPSSLSPHSQCLANPFFKMP